MERLSAASVRGTSDLPGLIALSRLVYTRNESYEMHRKDLREIHEAAWKGKDQKLQKMMEKKKTMDLNMRDGRNRTALHLACAFGHEKVVTLLVDRKCQIDVCDKEHRTPLMKAIQYRKEGCANILIDSGADITIADVNGNTALHCAIYIESLSMVAKLLSHGADIEVKNKATLTPLLLAITKRNVQIVEFLLSKKANANAVNEYKCTALILAVYHRSSEIVGMLLQQNVDIYAEDMRGLTAERYAAAYGFDEILEQLLDYKQKTSKYPQNSNPEGTPEETPDADTRLAEGTLDEVAGLAEGTLDKVAGLAEGTPDADARLAEGTPDADARLAEGTPDADARLAEGTPDADARLAEGTPDADARLAEGTPDADARLAEGTPDADARLAEGTPDADARLAEGTPDADARLAEGTPDADARLAEGTLDMVAGLAEGTLDEAARLAEATPDEDAHLVERTSEEVKCLVERTPEKAAPLVEGSSDKIRYLRNATSGRIEQSAEETPMKPAKETSAKFAWTAQGKPTQITWVEEKQPEKTKCLASVTSYKTEVVETGISEMSERSTEETSTKASTNGNVSSVKSIFSKPSMENLQSIKIEEDFSLANKEGALKTVTGQQEDDICIIEQAPQDQTNKMPTSESGPKEYGKSSSDSEVNSETAAKNSMCLPEATYQKEIKTINGKREDQMFPSESEEEEDETKSWDSESLFESVKENRVCLLGATYQKEMKTINGKLEDQMFPSESEEGEDETKSWDSESLFESVQENHVCLHDATYQQKIKTIFGKLVDQMFPSESKQEEDEKNSWDSESLPESVQENHVCLLDATYQKEMKTINEKLEDQMFPSESKQEEDEKNSWDSESLPESVQENHVCLLDATYQKEMKTINEKLEDQMFPSESKQEEDEKNSWDSESLPESVQENHVCLLDATYQKEMKTINEKLEDQMFPSESKQEEDEKNSWDSESLPESVQENHVCLLDATYQKEMKTINEKLEDQMFPSESKQEEDEKNSWDSESLPESVQENHVCLLDATYQKEMKTINEKLEDQMFPSESKQEEDEKNSWDSESLSESVQQKYVCLPDAAYQKEIKTINGKMEESPDVHTLLKPFCGMKDSVPNKALELKDIQRFKAEDVSSVEFPLSLFSKLTMENLRSTKVEEDINLATKVNSEHAAQNYMCLPQTSYQKEIKTINGKIEEPPKKPSDFEPAIEMQNSVSNIALEWKNEQTLGADSPILSKILDVEPSCKRARELKIYHCKQLTEKMKQMKKKVCELQKELSEAKIKFQLENEKVKWQQELCSVRFTLNQEEEKRRNIDMLNENIREELGRIKEQHRKELEVRQQIEMAHRMQDMELKSLRSNFNQVSHTRENENDLLHEDCVLEKEIAMLKLERDTLRHLNQEKENKYFEDMKILKEKNAELQITLKQKKKTLTKRAPEYSEQLKVLTAENTMLTSKLKEKQDKEILKTEIESYHPRLASAIQDHDQNVASSKKQELAFHASGDAHLQGKMNVDVNNVIYNNEMPHQPLSEVQSKSKSLKMTNYAGDAVRENTLVLEHAQRDLSEIQCQLKKVEYMYKNEEDNVHPHTEQQESLEQRLLQLESKNIWLRQQLVHALKKANNKSKITINIRFLERKKEHHLLREKNEEIVNNCKRLKECIYQYEKEKAEREVIIRQLQKKLAGLHKQCVSEASLEVTSHCDVNHQDEIQNTMKTLFQTKSQDMRLRRQQ
ncbi:ankyrin repeat domain-containing protein 30A [Callithrix jacchus]